MATKYKLLKTIKICKDALDSCGDNYGSESADNGNIEKYFDDKLVNKALEKIKDVM